MQCTIILCGHLKAIRDAIFGLLSVLLASGVVQERVFSFGSSYLKMGRKWGAIGRSKNVITYSLSPFEQRAFAGFQKSLSNFVRRVKWQLPYQLPAVIVGVLIYTWGTNDFIRRNRKNPKDYENDV